MVILRDTIHNHLQELGEAGAGALTAEDADLLNLQKGG